MTHFPLFLNLKDRKIIIFGGGKFALQRVEKLKPFSAKLIVISENISDKIKQIDGIEWHERTFIENDLDICPAFVVIAEDEETTEKIYTECKKRNIQVNAVDMPKFCDIIFPSVVSSEHLCIGVCSGGISPTATVEFKEQIENLLPENIDEILEWMIPTREYVNKTIAKEKQKSALRILFKAALSQNRSLDENKFRQYLLDL